MLLRHRTRQHIALPRLDVNQRPWKDLNALIDRIGEIAVLKGLNIHEKTLYRWVTGRGQIPGRQHLAIQLLLGEIPGTDGKWSGWFFKDGQLWSPENTPYTSVAIRASFYDAMRIFALQNAVDALRVKLAIAEQALDGFAPAANDRLRA